MKVNTLFPTHATDEAVKGGVILLKLNENNKISNQNIKLAASYKDTDGKLHSNEQDVKLGNRNNSGIKKRYF